MLLLVSVVSNMTPFHKQTQRERGVNERVCLIWILWFFLVRQKSVWERGGEGETGTVFSMDKERDPSMELDGWVASEQASGGGRGRASKSPNVICR